MNSDNLLPNRFDLRTSEFTHRTARIDSLLQRFNVVAATGSLIEAHLVVRLGLSRGIPNLVGCGTNLEEVSQLCCGVSNILLFITESVSSDYGADIINLLRKGSNPVKIFYMLQDCLIARRIQTFDVDAIVMCTSFGTGIIARALSELHAGRRYRDPAIMRHLAHCDVVLTRREQQVLQFLQLGLTNKEISAQLSISSVTIRDYIQNLMAKLGASNRTMVVANARRAGLI